MELKGTVITKEEWDKLSADKLRAAISLGDGMLIKQKNGKLICVPARQFYDDVAHAEDFFLPGWWR
jgi:hypothetical protein